MIATRQDFHPLLRRRRHSRLARRPVALVLASVASLLVFFVSLAGGAFARGRRRCPDPTLLRAAPVLIRRANLRPWPS
jgi:hypothetical protein